MAKRVRIEPNIYRYAATGRYEARVWVAGRSRHKCFAPTTSLGLIRAWAKAAKVEGKLDHQLQVADAARLKPSLDGWCYVYFVRSGEEVKIGRATDVRQRLRSLQVAHSGPLALVLSIAAHAALESAIQQRFDHLRIAGEWFRLAPDLIEFLQAVQQGANPVALLFEAPLVETPKGRD